MAHLQSQYGDQARKTDEYGNPVSQTDEYGNPVHHPVSQTDEYGNPVHHSGGTAFGTTGTGAGYGTTTDTGRQHRTTGDTGYGTAVDTGTAYGTTGGTGGGTGYGTTGGGTGHGTTTGGTGTGYGTSGGMGTGYGTTGQHHGREGHQHDVPSHGESGGYEASGEQHHEKKGIMDKIKEKLPGRHD